MVTLFIFSLGNAFRKKSASLIAILGVTLGCALMIFILSLSQGINKRVEKTFNALASTIIISPKDAFFGGLFLGGGTPLPKSYIAELKRIPYLKSAYTQVSALIRSQIFKEDLNIILPIVGYETQENNVILNNIIEGRKPLAENEIVVGRRLKDSLNFLKVNLKYNQSYQMINPQDKRGIIRFKIVGTFETGSELVDTTFYGPANLVRKFALMPQDKVSSINVVVVDLKKVDQVSKSIERALKNKNPPVQVVVPINILNPLLDTLKVFNYFLYTIVAAAALAGGLFILIIMLASVTERKREFGVLKAIGWSSGNIIFLVMLESLILCFLGTFLGVALGYGGITLVQNLIFKEILSLNGHTVVYTGFFGVFLGVMGGIYPAWRAQKVSPVEILRQV